MQVFLSQQCLSLTGLLRTDLGYYLRSTKKGNFYAQRSKHSVPPDGHWRFIVLCAELAQNKLHITDIEVSQKEIMKALHEMHRGAYLWKLSYPNILHADDVLSLKSRLGL